MRRSLSSMPAPRNRRMACASVGRSAARPIWLRRLAEHIEVVELRGGLGLAAAGQLPARRQQLLEPGVGDGLDEGAHQEAVGEGGEMLVLGQAVGGADAHAQRAVQHGVAAAEGALVEQRQERVEDGGGAEEHLVEERQIRLGQHAGGLGLDDALLELAQIDRPENLRRLGEAPHQVLEHPAAEPLGDAPHRLALGGAGRADHQEVLLGDGAQDDQLDDRLALHQPAVGVGDGEAKRFSGGGDARGRRGGHA